jgi:hypothetical protein
MSLNEFAAGIACIVATDAAKCECRSFTVCPPPPASANGSVRSLAAPAEPGVGVGTSRGREVLHARARWEAAATARTRNAWFREVAAQARFCIAAGCERTS